MKFTASSLLGRLLASATFFTIISNVAMAQAFTPLYAFTGGSDGGSPVSGMILDASGNLYGTTSGTQTNFGTTMTLLLLEHLNEITDRKMQTEIEEAKHFILQQTSNASCQMEGTIYENGVPTHVCTSG
jgi:hypothetical protein